MLPHRRLEGAGKPAPSVGLGLSGTRPPRPGESPVVENGAPLSPLHVGDDGFRFSMISGETFARSVKQVSGNVVRP